MTFPIQISEQSGVRYLHFNSDWIQGAMRVARPWQLELEYTREMMTSLLLRPELPQRVLLIGLGAASLLKFLYRHFPTMQLTVVEIEPAVLHAARQFFKLPEDPARIRLVIADAVDYILQPGESFDLILLDGFNEDGRPGMLDTLPFYQACRARLSMQGILAVNLLSHNRGFKSSVERVLQAFDDRAFVFPSCESGNAIAFAAEGEPVEMALTELKALAEQLKAQTGLNLLPTLSRLAQAKTCLNETLVL